MIGGPKLNEEAARQAKLIKKWTKEAQDQHQLYSDLKRRPMEFWGRGSQFF